MTVTVTKDLVKEVVKSINALVKHEVLVGIPQDKDARPDSPIGNAAIGYILDAGSPVNNLPARPWLIPGMEDGLPDAVKQMRKGAAGVLDGKVDAGMKGMVAAGLISQNAVKAKVNSNIQPKLAEATIEARERRGVTRTNTLVDTGELRNAVTYVIAKK